MVHRTTNSTVLFEELMLMASAGNAVGATLGAQAIDRGLCSGELEIDPMAMAFTRLGTVGFTKKHPSLAMVSVSLNKIADKHYPDH